MPNIVETYKGVDIEESCGHFYPTFNGNVEFKTKKELKAWIRRIWHPAQRQLKALGLQKQFIFAMNTGIFK